MGIFSRIFGIVDHSEIREALKEGAILIDVRSAAEFALGSVPGAVNIPVDLLPYQLEELSGKENIIVFCRSGHRSSIATDFLKRKGFSNVIDGKTPQEVIECLNKNK